MGDWFTGTCRCSAGSSFCGLCSLAGYHKSKWLVHRDEIWQQAWAMAISATGSSIPSTHPPQPPTHQELVTPPRSSAIPHHSAAPASRTTEPAPHQPAPPNTAFTADTPIERLTTTGQRFRSFVESAFASKAPAERSEPKPVPPTPPNAPTPPPAREPAPTSTAPTPPPAREPAPTSTAPTPPPAREPAPTSTAPTPPPARTPMTEPQPPAPDLKSDDYIPPWKREREKAPWEKRRDDSPWDRRRREASEGRLSDSS